MVVLPANTTAPAAPNAAAEAKTANLIYILYLVTLVVGVSELVGLIMAYVHKDTAPAWIQTHYRFQIRTFWIGLIYICAGVITVFLVVGWFILLFFAVWYILRAVKGMKLLGGGLPHPNPATWLW
jgi:uncharacterized membrane protein